jgi:hypothetical protein
LFLSPRSVTMCPANYNPSRYKIRAVIFTLKTWVLRNPLRIMYGGLRPKCNEWRHCKTMVQNVQRWANKYSRWTAKWSVIYTEWWPCPKCWPENLWKTALNSFRTFLWISSNFTHWSVRLSCQHVLRKTGSINAPRCAQNAENGVWFYFYRAYHKYGDEFLNHIVRVSDDETWLSFLNDGTKEQSKQWMHTHSPNKQKMFQQTSACLKADGNCILGHNRGANGGIHATRNHNGRSVTA